MQEIALPTKGYGSVQQLYEENLSEDAGEIALCSLAAIAAGLTTDEEYEDVAYYACLMIDNVLSLMDYPFPHLKATATYRRNIGVGITNLAYDMASRGLKYSSLEGKRHIYYHAERHTYWLYKASTRLAKERGAADGWYATKYADGWLPIDTANAEIQKRLGVSPSLDWEGYRQEMKLYGGRFSVVCAIMPCEASAVASGHTNSVYPVRALKLVKTSGTNKNLFIAPDSDKLAGSYELAWDVSATDMAEMYAAIQCFTDQAISADYYIKYDNEGSRELSTKQLLADWLTRVKLGAKTRYYINSSTSVAVKEAAEAPVCEACSL